MHPRRPGGARGPRVARPLQRDAALCLPSSARRHRCCRGEARSWRGQTLCRSISGRCKPHILPGTEGREGTETLPWLAVSERLCRLSFEAFLRTPGRIAPSRKEDHRAAHARCAPREENGSWKGDGRKNHRRLVRPARPLSDTFLALLGGFFLSPLQSGFEVTAAHVTGVTADWGWGGWP